ncbi:MAG TPA: carbonic anhydrase [Polyangiaceae bacterium]|nr:carbonic anhydrase [Polyangiaceae bacterium]
MGSYEDIFTRNEAWAQRRSAADPDFFGKLQRPQTPEFLYVGCCDSRVTAEDMMGFEPGEAFVHRNVANVIHAIDLNATAAIQYAVKHLGVKHIVICGHYGCGGVAAAMQPKDLGILNPWLRIVRDVYRIHADELDAIPDHEARYRRLVELNVEEQCVNVIKMAVVQLGYSQTGFPLVHGAVFDPEKGRLRDLNIGFTDILHRMQRIYNLTDTPLV